MQQQKSNWKLYVIFHKFLTLEAYETLTDKDIEDHIRFVAVNASIQKLVPKRLTPFIMEERSLSWYNPFLQHNRFCESSVFFHAWKNPTVFLKETPYIGFIHYDMIVKKECLEFLDSEIQKAELEKKQVVFVHSALPARVHLEQVFTLEQWNSIVNIYNTVFGKSHTIYEVVDTEIPLYHTFVLHNGTFQRLMYFAEAAIPYMFELLGFDTKHLPYMIERLHGIFLALQKMDGYPSIWLPMPGLIHVDSLKDNWNK